MKKIFNPDNLVRKNIRKLIPYSSARSEYNGKAGIFLDANENSFGTITKTNPSLNLNRYPDPLQQELKNKISKIKKVNPENIFLGNGSDEPIDLLFRAFCEPSRDAVLLFPPTYGMYKVAAQINNVKIFEAPLKKDFQIDLQEVKKISKSKNLKLIFICSPNNPTGNLIGRESILKIADEFKGIVVLDEAYVDFSPGNSIMKNLADFPNLVILQTFSKAWGMAGARMGMAFASKKIIDVLNRIKAPYNINIYTQKEVQKFLRFENKKNTFVSKIIAERNVLSENLSRLTIVKKVFPSDSNFLLVKFHHAIKVFEFLRKNRIIVRNRTKEINCENCLRITVGTPKENIRLIQLLKIFSQ